MVKYLNIRHILYIDCFGWERHQVTPTDPGELRTRRGWNDCRWIVDC